MEPLGQTPKRCTCCDGNHNVNYRIPTNRINGEIVINYPAMQIEYSAACFRCWKDYRAGKLTGEIPPYGRFGYQRRRGHVQNVDLKLTAPDET